MISKLIPLTILFISLNIFSQKNEVGFFAGGSNYIGDIGPTTFINPSSLAIGFLYRKNFNKRISTRAKINIVNIKSNDLKSSSEFRFQRKKYFENTVLEFGLGLDFNFLDFDLTESSFQMSPYFSTGISFSSFNKYKEYIDVFDPITGLNTKKLETKKLGPKSSIVIPITLGYKIKPNNNFIFAIEVTANHSFTDNIDGSNDKKLLPAFGSSLSNDWYVYSGIIITYIFGKKFCCRDD